MVIIVMGVSGCGKTTIGKMLAHKLKAQFYDADDFHPIKNVKKMAAGIPLTDEDRKPWLETLNYNLQKLQENSDVVLACSALKESYRKILKNGLKELKWVFLSGSQDIIDHRMKNRKDHFMHPELLQSQFLDLEEPVYAIKVDVSDNPELITNQIIEKI